MSQTLSQAQSHTPQNGESTIKFVTPLANILESQDGYVLEAEMPGVNRDGLEVTVENGELTIIGRRQRVTNSNQPVYRESRDFDYRRVFELDPTIDSTRIQAKIDQGVLRLTLPKAESVKPRRIAVTE